jgi:hypothetical protein
MTIQSGLMPELLEALEHLQALGDLLDLGFGAGGCEVVAQLLDLRDRCRACAAARDALGAHHRAKLVAELLELGE